MQMLEALPLLGMDFRVPSKDDPAWRAQVNPVLALGRGLIFEGGVDPRRIALRARLPIMLLRTTLVFALATLICPDHSGGKPRRA